MHLGDFEVEPDDPLDEPGQRALIWQVGAQSCRASSQDDLAVVEFRAHDRAGVAREGDSYIRTSAIPSQHPGSVCD